MFDSVYHMILYGLKFLEGSLRVKQWCYLTMVLPSFNC